MKLATKLRLILFVGLFAALEIGCRAGYIGQLTMIPPSEMITGLVRIVASGSLIVDLPTTFISFAIATLAAVVVGFGCGVLLHAIPRIRRTVDPFLATYYALPNILFYPLFIAMFGLNDVPKIIIAFLHAAVIMTTNTLNGIDRVPPVLNKTSQVMNLNRTQRVFLITLPSATPYLFTGVKLAISYSLVGIIGSEFILSTHGLGYRISYAFHGLDNQTMYSLLLLVMIIVFGLNAALAKWERRLAARRGRR